MPSHRLALGKKAWDLYLAKNELDSRLVRTEVANSWQRCRTFHVDPTRPAGDDSAATHILQDKLYEKDQLCRVAQPFLRDLYYFLSGTDFQVILADETGFLLQTMGDSHIISRTKRVQLCPGTSWSESSKGTNAIGTALYEKKPVQIFAWEHFCERNQFLTCCAAPINDAGGNVVAVVDVSGDCRYANSHTLGMVVATAKAIENQMLLERANHKLYVASRYSDALMLNVSDGFIAVDGNGIVTEVNAKGGQIFGIAPSDAKGRHLDLVCPGHGPIIETLNSGRLYENEEILLQPEGTRVRSSAAPLRDEQGGIVGAVAVFHEISERQTARRPAIPNQGHAHKLEDIVGESPQMLAAKEWVRLAAANSSTVLILGESGTGKELFAHAIHDAGPRRGRPFVAVNCAALPEGLIESELFGYSDGTFTGARKGGQAGKFELANGGTIFLDEVGDMPLAVQAKLLRVLQERKVVRLGSVQEMPIDIRVIAATHKDLKAQLEQAKFREDLYYRLTVLEILVPPLRDRPGDIPALTTRLAAKITTKLNRSSVRFSDGFLAKLTSYAWPGNVRELENVLERAIVRIGHCDVLGPEQLQLSADTPTPSTLPPPTEVPAKPIRTLREVERAAIAEALSLCGGNVLRTASRLGISRNTLYRKIEEFQLAPHS